MSNDERTRRTSGWDDDTIARESDRGHRLAEAARLAREFARIGTVESVPWIMISDSARRALALGEVANAVLSFVDGRRTVGAIIETSEMPSAEVMATLVELAHRRVIALR